MTTKEREPYTAQGGWNLVKPDGSVLMFQGGFERDTILKLLNEAHALGAASKTSLGGELGWIPVGERLPVTLEVHVLCLHKPSKNIFVCYRTNDCINGREKWFGGSMPTHWMPLPEAPTEP